jgi:hypothetical protein
MTDLNNVLYFRAHVLTGWRLSHTNSFTVQTQSYFTTGCLPPVNLGVNPLMLTTREFFFQLNPLRSQSLCNILAPTVLLITCRLGPHSKHRSSVAVSIVFEPVRMFPWSLLSHCLATVVVYRAISLQRLLYNGLSRGRCLAKGLHLTILSCILVFSQCYYRYVFLHIMQGDK